MTLYIMIETDKYELPIAVFDDIEELAKFAGVKKKSILSAMAHFKSGVINSCKYLRVNI